MAKTSEFVLLLRLLQIPSPRGNTDDSCVFFFFLPTPEQRKAKRLALRNRKKGKDGEQSTKRETGVPNVRHFKECAQRQAELRKKRVEEMQEKQRASRAREVMKRRSLESFQKDAQKRQREFEHKETELKSLEKNVNFENETSRKAYYREFKKVVESADVILEVLDARDPLGCRCPQVEQAVVQSGTSKRIVLVLNKIDLVSKDIIEKWLKYLRNEFPTVAFKASTQQQNRNLQRSRVPASQASAELLGSSACVGAECLMKLLGNYCRNLDIKTAITVGVVGFPNVGKSSLINSLKRARACNVGATPGVTKCLQQVHLDKHIKLLDCPGIVMATSSSDAALILRNCVKIEQLLDPVTPVEAILKRCNKQQIMQHYGVPDFRTASKFLALLACRQGRLKKGGVPDHDKAAKSVLLDWTGGRISYFTHPPEIHSLPTHVSAEIVMEMGKAFDLEQLEQDTQEALAELTSSVAPNGICMESAGLTSGGAGEQPTEQEMEGAPQEEEELQDTGEEEEEELQAMEEEKDLEFGQMTVQIKEGRSQRQRDPEGAAKLPNLGDILGIDPLQQGQALRAAGKKRKKQQKRADKIATKLSDTLTSAMNFEFSD
ncbi:guanine nucleotide-binding protein-like 3-like protein [Acipenser oxyrinchus oxyrinchus]|uniref:Guanine nucleotide-binding protein-like 3-like protein n=1 Tax=Acipenser oxyrinchus oxyrinchus TaxID=40147 RepID=A0AAD8CKP2_ACIOX|nr:guanine nucleotide-binding protein-like 3-like protein [Acipenser oxyrinchus oxyrinchus]